MTALLEVRELAVDYRVRSSVWGRSRSLPALRDVSLSVGEGETLGVVGESGCGKSTLARALVGLVSASAGDVRWRGQVLAQLRSAQRQAIRREMQMVFQDPAASLDPRMRVAALVAEPLQVFEPELPASRRRERVLRMLERVGLAAEHLTRFPHELSGGQCQRVAIARALVPEPRLLVCDEPVSSLDVSVQAQIVNLLRDLQRDLGLSLVFISHNMAVVRQLSARILVMYLGRVMEVGARESVFAEARHPYTRALLAAIPPPDPRAQSAAHGTGHRTAHGTRQGAGPQVAHTVASGEILSPLDPPPGCVFGTRCPWVQDRCREAIPPLESTGAHGVACVRWRELTR